MKIKVLVFALCMSLFNICHAQQTALQPELPDPVHFKMLPDEIKLRFFEDHIEPAKTLPQLLRLVRTWKQVNTEFNYFASTPLVKRSLGKKKLDILGSIQDKLEENKIDYGETQFAYLTGLLDPRKNENLIPILNEKEMTTVQSLQALERILSHILAIVAAYPNELSLMKTLWLNGADVNFNVLISKPPCEQDQLCYNGETPLQSAILGAIHRRLYSLASPLPIKDEIAKLEYLLAKGANPNKVNVYSSKLNSSKPCVTLLFEWWKHTLHYPYNPNIELSNYILQALNLLLQKNAGVSADVIKQARYAAFTEKNPGFYEVLMEYGKV